MSKKSKICPLCHKNDKVIPIIYGEPTSQIMEKAEKGEVKLGGCVMSKSNAKWYCKRDKVEF